MGKEKKIDNGYTVYKYASYSSRNWDKVCLYRKGQMLEYFVRLLCRWMPRIRISVARQSCHISRPIFSCLWVESLSKWDDNNNPGRVEWLRRIGRSRLLNGCVQLYVRLNAFIWSPDAAIYGRMLCHRGNQEGIGVAPRPIGCRAGAIVFIKGFDKFLHGGTAIFLPLMSVICQERKAFKMRFSFESLQKQRYVSMLFHYIIIKIPNIVLCLLLNLRVGNSCMFSSRFGYWKANYLHILILGFCPTYSHWMSNWVPRPRSSFIWIWTIDMNSLQNKHLKILNYSCLWLMIYHRVVHNDAKNVKLTVGQTYLVHFSTILNTMMK